MRYYYGTSDSYHIGKGTIISPKELAEKIIDDVKDGKWNTYYGGQINSIDATCRYSKPGFILHDRLFMFGNYDEFRELERLIKPFMEKFTPRCFKDTFYECEEERESL